MVVTVGVVVAEVGSTIAVIEGKPVEGPVPDKSYVREAAADATGQLNDRCALPYGADHSTRSGYLSLASDAVKLTSSSARSVSRATMMC